MDFYNACIKNNIKPIIGLEINLQHKFIIYAKTNEGYQNLLMINKIQSERPLKGSELKKYNQDILCIIPYEMRNFKDKMMEIYEDLYVGVSLPSEEGLYVQETVFLKPSDREYMPYLDAIKAGTSIDKIEIKQNDNRYLYLPNQLSTTHLEFVAEIVEKCNVTIEPRQDLMIKYPTEEPIKLIQKLCREEIGRAHV